MLFRNCAILILIFSFDLFAVGKVYEVPTQFSNKIDESKDQSIRANSRTFKIYSEQVIPIPSYQNLNYGLGASAGVLPTDSHYNYVSYGASFARAFNETWSWEILQYNRFITNASNSDIYIQERFPTNVLQSNALVSVLTSSLIYTPVVSKHISVLPRWTKQGATDVRSLWGDLSAVFAFGKSEFEKNKNVDTYAIGVLLRLYKKNDLSLNLDFRNLFYKQEELPNQYFINFSIVKYVVLFPKTESL